MLENFCVICLGFGKFGSDKFSCNFLGVQTFVSHTWILDTKKHKIMVAFHVYQYKYDRVTEELILRVHGIYSDSIFLDSWDLCSDECACERNACVDPAGIENP